MKTSLHEFPTAAQLKAVLASQAEMVGGVAYGRRRGDAGGDAPLAVCEGELIYLPLHLHFKRILLTI